MTPDFYAVCPSCHNPRKLRTGTKYADSHTQWPATEDYRVMLVKLIVRQTPV